MFLYRKDRPLLRQITEGDYSFPRSLWEGISKEAIDLVRRLMEVDPKKRLTAAEAMEHEWMQDQEVVDRALKLMATQKSGWMPPITPTSALRGILPSLEVGVLIEKVATAECGNSGRVKKRRGEGDDDKEDDDTTPKVETPTSNGGCKRQKRSE